MEERLVVKNFGPLKDVDIPLKDVMVFIGPQGSGKSTIAKLLAICSQVVNQPLFKISEKLTDFGIGYGKFDIIKYITNKYSLSIDANGVSLNNHFPNYSISVLRETIQGISEQYRTLQFASIERVTDKLKYDDYKESALTKIDYLSKLPEFFNETYLLENSDEKYRQEMVDFRDYLQLELSLLKDEIYLINQSHDFKQPNILDALLKVFRGLNAIYLRMEYLFSSPILLYIPAERIFLPSISNSVYGLINNNVLLQKELLEFGSEFEKAKIAVGEYFVDFLNVHYKFHNDIDKVLFNNKSGEVALKNAASGHQSTIPMLLTIEYTLLHIGYKSRVFIIEEPELNLYPSAQKKLVDFLVKKCTTGNDKLIITTHSPYILTALNNHIEAAEASKNSNVIQSELEEIMPKESWLDFDRVGAFYVDNGTCKDILNYEEQLISAEQIDSASDEILDEFSNLSELKYKK